MKQRKVPIYENYSIFSPTGKKMFFCSQKKFNWYLSKKIAKQIGDTEARLLFMPNGEGEPDHLLEIRKNICSVCGCDDIKNLTRHHLIPYCYRRSMPNHYKRHNSLYVIPICRSCHDKYEVKATLLKEIIAEQYNIPKRHASQKYKAYRAASTLLKYGDGLPDDRKEYLSSQIREHLNRNFTNLDLEEMASCKIYSEVKDHASNVIGKVQELNKLDEFCDMWMRHFEVVMKPKFMPEILTKQCCYHKSDKRKVVK